MSSATQQTVFDEDLELRAELPSRQLAALESVRNCPPAPLAANGRGIVICGGGGKYLPCAWVEIKMLRMLDCQLPIELWHLAGEVPEYFAEILAELGVRTVDASALLPSKPARTLRGWEMKAYAILHCPFREVLLLDADNVPVKDPSYLFDLQEFKRSGAVFWPDYRCLGPTRAIWEICGVEYRHEPEFETGQILVDKVRHWLPLNLAMHYNEHSDFYYRHIHGDKETFHMAFRRLEVEYSMPIHSIHPIEGTMCQHDFDGNRVFQHRNFAKWSLFGANRRVGGFLYEDECLAFLNELRGKWIGSEHGTPVFEWERATLEERDMAEALCARPWRYRRVGHDERTMSFSLKGIVDQGAAACEIFWYLRSISEGNFELLISSEKSTTCRLLFKNDRWEGQWVIAEQMPVQLLSEGEA